MSLAYGENSDQTRSLIHDLDQRAVSAMIRVFGRVTTMAVLFHIQHETRGREWSDDEVRAILARIKALVDVAPLDVEGPA